jgi:hypothetical protein
MREYHGFYYTTHWCRVWIYYHEASHKLHQLIIRILKNRPVILFPLRRNCSSGFSISSNLPGFDRVNRGRRYRDQNSMKHVPYYMAVMLNMTDSFGGISCIPSALHLFHL